MTNAGGTVGGELVGGVVPFERDDTDEVARILSDLEPGARAAVERAIQLRRAELALGPDASGFLKGLERRLEEHIRADTESQRKLGEEIEGLNSLADQRLNQLERKLTAEIRAAKAPTTLQVVIGEGCKLSTQALKIALANPRSLAVLAGFVLLLVALVIVAFGGSLTTAWGDLALSVGGREHGMAPALPGKPSPPPVKRPDDDDGGGPVNEDGLP